MSKLVGTDNCDSGKKLRFENEGSHRKRRRQYLYLFGPLREASVVNCGAASIRLSGCAKSRTSFYEPQLYPANRTIAGSGL